MNSREYLGQAYRIDKRINSKLEQIASLRELAGRATNYLTETPHSAAPNSHPMESIIVKMMDLENEINHDIDTLVELKREIVSIIKGIKITEHQTLLELRYLCFKSWEQISVEMHYTLRHVDRLHNQALQSVVIPNDVM